VTLEESWNWLASFTNLEKNLSAVKRTWRLDRMHALLADRGHPERQGLSVHLAGSKGKGSTAAYLSSIFTAAGVPTGLYASPHVQDWRERITLNGAFFSDATYTAAVAGLSSFWDGMDRGRRAQFVETWGGEPTTFEWLTLAAFELFTAERVEARVWETGLGGRLDATNTQTPSAVVLTLIELEHTDILGDTRTAIAGEKAGILKAGVPAYAAPQKLDVLEVFRREAARVGAPLRSFDEDIDELETELSLDGTDLTLGLADGTRVQARLPMLGQAQGLNAAVAAWVAHGLVRDGLWILPPGVDLGTVVRTGLEQTRLPGRMQVLSRNPWVVVDGAHTAESARLLAQSWGQLFGPGGTLVFGAFEGKAVEPMAAALAPLFRRVIVTRPGTFRPSDPEALRRAFLEAPGTPGLVDIAPDPATALAWALQDGLPVLAAGSFYLAGELLGKL
jgi:dihydrofolate synthase/folylpolyglutamate synthase